MANTNGLRQRRGESEFQRLLGYIYGRQKLLDHSPCYNGVERSLVCRDGGTAGQQQQKHQR